MIRSQRLSWQPAAAAAGVALVLTAAGCSQGDSKPAAPASPAAIAKMQASLHRASTNDIVFESPDFKQQLSQVVKPEKPAAVTTERSPMLLMQRTKTQQARDAVMVGMGLGMRGMEPVATVNTNKGDFRIALSPSFAPAATGQFVTLAYRKFYDGLKFWRYEPGYIIQTGDPKNNGTGGPGYTIPDDVSDKLKHVRGAVVMAKAGPDTAGSQFYITLTPQHQLDGKDSVLGVVTKGMDVVQRLRAGDKILSISLSNLPPDFDPAKITSMAQGRGMMGGAPPGQIPPGDVPPGGDSGSGPGYPTMAPAASPSGGPPPPGA